MFSTLQARLLSLFIIKTLTLLLFTSNLEAHQFNMLSYVSLVSPSARIKNAPVSF